MRSPRVKSHQLVGPDFDNDPFLLRSKIDEETMESLAVQSKSKASSDRVRRGQMSNSYMNKIFWQAIHDSTKPGTKAALSKPLWSLDENESIFKIAPRKTDSNRSFFSEEEQEQLRILDRRFGKFKNLQLDETGKILTREQELINKKVKAMLIKVGLVPSDKELAEEERRFSLVPVNTQSPYKSDRPRVRLF